MKRIGTAINPENYNRRTYKGFSDWFFDEVFCMQGRLGRLNFFIIIVTLHFLVLGISAILVPLFPPVGLILFLGFSFLLFNSGLKRVRDIRDCDEVGVPTAVGLFICSFIPVIWQLMLIGLVFIPSRGLSEL
ncbi:hypothetical protein A9Q84_14470 [Halobacteriovorax marinus]|uniref:Uncharacterized protein n=1 Tax=Halobacteriovorax marinus TaxID=97084 RepID=A0A1Y5F4X5_9BACT|nr:hypothetical protein A9Q84_14470 [Halobacteriovorax marinus]